jgi:hypothetical protein
LQEVKAPTLLRQTANRWRQGCQLYVPAALYPQVSLFLKFDMLPEVNAALKCSMNCYDMIKRDHNIMKNLTYYLRYQHAKCSTNCYQLAEQRDHNVIHTLTYYLGKMLHLEFHKFVATVLNQIFKI